MSGAKRLPAERDGARTAREHGRALLDDTGRGLLVAVAAASAALGLRVLLAPLIGVQAPLLTFLGAVMVAGWAGGIRPALLATLLSTAAIWWLYGPAGPIEPGAYDGRQMAYMLGMFVTVSLGIGLLCESLHRYRRRAEEHSALLDQAHDGVMVWDLQGRITYWSEAAARLYGWSAAEARGRDVRRLLCTEFAEPGEAPLAVLRARGTWAGRLVQVSRSGRRVIVDSRMRLVERDARALVLESNRDVTDRVDVERRLRLALESASMGTWEVDYGSGTLTVSEEVGPLFGLPRGHALGTLDGWLARMHPEDRARIAPELRRPAGDHLLDNFEYRVVLPDGRTRWLESQGRAAFDAGGRRVRAAGTVHDVTGRRMLEQRLRVEEERLRVALEGTEGGLWDEDFERGTAVWSQRLRELLGAPTDEPASSALFLRLVHADDRDAVIEYLRRARAGAAGDRLRLEFRVRTLQGERWLMARGRVHHGRDGRVVRTSGLVFDVTDRRSMEEELRLADQRKDEFLATLAHELRNPLAPIRYATRLLRPGTPPEAADEARQIIERQLAHVARLVDDLLDVSRITRGKLELRRAPLELGDAVRAALETARPLVEAQGHALAVQLEPALPVDGDATRLAQAIANLLNNAAKYTEPGGRIAVRGRRDGDAVELEVADSGIGIAPEQLPRLFEPFTQLHDGTDRAQGGLGIGLALARRLAEMHGGSLVAHSEGRGRGSRFVLRVPARAEASRAETPAATKVVPLFPGLRRALVVDDNVDAAASLALVLEFSGYRAHVAHDGLAAIEMAEVLRPDAIVLDVGMPRMNGVDAARHLRAQPWGRELTLVAVTGWGQDHDRARTREAGFDEHLTKPVEPDRLLEALARHQARRRGATRGAGVGE